MKSSKGYASEFASQYVEQGIPDFNLDQYAKERSISSGSDGFFNAYNQYYNVLRSFAYTLDKDSKTRGETYQDPKGFSSYAIEKKNDAKRIADYGSKLSAYVSANASAFDKVYGEGYAQSLIDSFSQNGEYLTSIGSGLDSEFDFWNSFQNKGEYDYFYLNSKFDDGSKKIVENADKYLSSYESELHSKYEGALGDTWKEKIANMLIATVGGSSAGYDSAARERAEKSYYSIDERWSDDQKKRFATIYAEKGFDEASLYAYYTNIENAQEAKAEAYKRISDRNEKNPLGQAIQTVIALPASMFGWIYEASIQNFDARMYPGLTSREYANAVTQDISQRWASVGDLNDLASEILKKKVDIPVIGDASFGTAYNIGFSMLQSQVNKYIALLTGGTSTLAGIALTAATFGAPAAMNAYYESISKGVPEGRAALFGAVVGAAETVFEHMGLDRLLNGTVGRNALVRVLKYALGESLEEVGTETVDTFADIIINQDKSQYQDDVARHKKELLSKGKSEEEAEAIARSRAALDAAERVAQAGLAGFISGGLMGTGAEIRNDINFHRDGKSMSESQRKNAFYTAENVSYLSDTFEGLSNKSKSILASIKSDVKAYNALADKNSYRGEVLIGRIASNLNSFNSTIESSVKDNIKRESRTKKGRERIAARFNAAFGTNLTFNDILNDENLQNQYSVLAYLRKIGVKFTDYGTAYSEGATNTTETMNAENGGTNNESTEFSVSQPSLTASGTEGSSEIYGGRPGSIFEGAERNVDTPAAVADTGMGRSAEAEIQSIQPADRAVREIPRGAEITPTEVKKDGMIYTAGTYHVENETEDMQQARSELDSIGVKANFFVGGDFQDEEGHFINAMIIGNEAWIRADDPDLSPLLLARHEKCHNLIDNGVISIADAYKAAEKIAKTEDLYDLAQGYIEIFTGVDVDYALMEIVCDAYAGINIFSDNAKRSANMGKVSESVQGYARERENANRPQAPPTQTETTTEEETAAENGNGLVDTQSNISEETQEETAENTSNEEEVPENFQEVKGIEIKDNNDLKKRMNSGAKVVFLSDESNSFPIEEIGTFLPSTSEITSYIQFGSRKILFNFIEGIHQFNGDIVSVNSKSDGHTIMTFKILNGNGLVDTARYNFAYREKHKQQISEKFEQSASVTTLQNLLSVYSNVSEMWEKICTEIDSYFLNNWNDKVFADRSFTFFKQQMGYKYAGELSTMCKKGIALFEAIDRITYTAAFDKLYSGKIGAAEKMILYDVLTEKGFVVPCSVCYVEQARKREGDIIARFVDGDIDGKVGWNSTLAEVEKRMKEKGVDYSFPRLSNSIETDAYSVTPINMDERTQIAFYESLQELANEAIKEYNETEKNKRSLLADYSPESVKKSLGGNITTNLKVFKVLFNNPDSRFIIDSKFLYNSMTMLNLAVAHKDLFTLFNQQGGVSGYKTKQRDIVYLGDIWKKRSWTSEATRRQGGIRTQSNSDFMAYLFFDYFQMYCDMTARGSHLQAYTKVLAELKLFGLSDGKLNASLIPAVMLIRNEDGTINEEMTRENAGLDQNGKPLYNDSEGINHNEAFMLISDKDYSKNVCGCCIGFSDKHILALLDEDLVQLIIGYHDKTNDPAKRYWYAKYANNYNGINEAIDENGKTVHVNFNDFILKAEKAIARKTSVEFNGETYAYDDIPKFAADLYLDYCNKKGYTPAYASVPGVIEHPNYYKLLADYGLKDSEGHYAPMKPVNVNIPETVPYLENGVVKSISSSEYLANELKDEMKLREDIDAALSDESEDGIIPEFVKRANELYERQNAEHHSFARRDNGNLRKPASDIVDAVVEFAEAYETENEVFTISKTAKNDTRKLIEKILAENTQQGKMRYALEAADMLLNRIYIEKAAIDNESYEKVIEALKPYLHKMRISQYRADLKHKYDTGVSAVYALWEAKSGEESFSPEQVKAEIEEKGIRIDSDDPQEIMIQINDMYRKAVRALRNGAKQKLRASLSDEEAEERRKEIAEEIINKASEIDTNSPDFQSRLTRYMSDMIKKYEREINDLRTKLGKSYTYGEALLRLMKSVQGLVDLSDRRYVNASVYMTDAFNRPISLAVRIRNKDGTLNSDARKIAGEISEFFSEDNPILGGNTNDIVGFETFEIGFVRDSLLEIKNGKGSLTVEELDTLRTAFEYINHLAKHFNKVFINGKYEDAKPIAEKYKSKIEENESKGIPILLRGILQKYIENFADPMFLFRYADRFEEDGFFTEIGEMFREGELDKELCKSDLTKEMREWMDEHPDFLKDSMKRTVKYNGQDIPIAIARSLYMTWKRDDAWGSLAYTGIEYIDRKRKHIKIDGVSKEELSAKEIEELAKAMQGNLYSQFSDLDKEFIGIIENAMFSAKTYKSETDMKVKGFTNVLSGYYYPKTISGKAINFKEEVNSGNSERSQKSSFKKSTITNKNRLLIRQDSQAFASHMNGVSTYYGLALPVQNFNVLYNLNLSDNPRAPVTLRGTIKNYWRDSGRNHGYEAYIRDLINDLQGVGKDSGEGWTFLRGAYARSALGFKPKVWFNQFSSALASTSIIDPDLLLKAITVKSSDVDTYSKVARLRAEENVELKSQGALDYVGLDLNIDKLDKILKKIERVSDISMIPIEASDRIWVRLVFAASQLQVQRNHKGNAEYKVGTEKNKKEAGKLTDKVIQETQQSSMKMERTMASRSSNQLLRTVSMFKADGIKVGNRTIESIMQYFVAKESGDKAKIKYARKHMAKAICAQLLVAAYLTGISALFKKLMRREEEDDKLYKDLLLDFSGNLLLTGLPLIIDIYEMIVNGYEIGDDSYSVLNDLVSYVQDITTKLIQGKADWKSFRNLVEGVSSVFGVSAKNLYDDVSMLVGIFSYRNAAYRLDDVFYQKSYAKDLAEAIEKEDDKLASTIIGVAVDKSIGDFKDKETRAEILRLSKEGYDVLPSVVPSSFTSDEVKYDLKNKDKRRFSDTYHEGSEVIEAMIAGKAYAALSDEAKAKALNIVYDFYYEEAKKEFVMKEDAKNGESVDHDSFKSHDERKELLKDIPLDIIACTVAFYNTSEAEKNMKGESISGTKRDKVFSYVKGLNIERKQKVELLLYLGYSESTIREKFR